MGEKASKFKIRPHGLHSNTLPLNQVFMTTTQFICSLLHIKNELIYIKYLFSCVTFLLMMPNKKNIKQADFCPTPPPHSRRRGKKYSLLTHASILFLSRVHPDASIPFFRSASPCAPASASPWRRPLPSYG